MVTNPTNGALKPHAVVRHDSVTKPNLRNNARWELASVWCLWKINIPSENCTLWPWRPSPKNTVRARAKLVVFIGISNRCCRAARQRKVNRLTIGAKILASRTVRHWYNVVCALRFVKTIGTKKPAWRGLFIGWLPQLRLQCGNLCF
jgi:hypothetical protein